jgi:hypothetical protein
MLASQTGELLRHLRVGQFDLPDVAYLEQLKANDLLADLAPVFPVRFQDRQLSEKWEIGMARSVCFELVAQRSRGSDLPTLILVPVLRKCLFLSGEAETVTGISMSPRILIRPIHKPFHGLALTTSRGYKLDKLLDGWEIKPLAKKTVKLAEDFLRQRGWRFDVLRQFIPQP